MAKRRPEGWRGPAFQGDFPSLGWALLDWYADMLVIPDGPGAGEPLIFTDEQARFVLRLYEIRADAVGPAIRGGQLVNGRKIRRAVLSRMKGWGKSPILGALCLGEGLGDVVFDGWDADGEPVARPWCSIGFNPLVQLYAASEAQTANAWEPLLEMAREGHLEDFYEIGVNEGFITVPRGRIEPTTSAALSREGFRLVFGILDQSESMTTSNGGVKLAEGARRNLSKTQGCSVEAPNAFVPGSDSVAERSHRAYGLQEGGHTRIPDGILVDHLEAPATTDITDRESLIEGIKAARGDSVWVSPERTLADFWDPDTDPADGRRYYLNQVWAAGDSWISSPEWLARRDATKVVADSDAITLGFDGSRHRARGVTDATALIGCRVADGHLFELGVWEQPPDVDDWEVPVVLVEAAVQTAFERHNVVGFYADPAKWESYVAGWEAAYGPRLKVKATRDHPIEWWMTGGRAAATVRALEEFHNALLDGGLTHPGTDALSRHALNARRRPSRAGLQIAKEFPDSPRKIDAIVAAVLAYTARIDAMAAGLAAPARSNVIRRY